MAAELSIFHAAVLTIDGVPFADVGSIAVPVKGDAAAIDDGSNPILKRVKVPAGEMVAAWAWADTEGMTYFEIALVGGEGYIQVGLRFNAPTSSTDLTPTGSINHWKDLGKSCVGRFNMDTERAYIHATAATAVGETDGFPTVWSSGSRVQGVADVIAFYNEGEDDVVVELFVCPK